MFENNTRRVIKDVASLPLVGDERYIYRNTTTGNFSTWNTVTGEYAKINNEKNNSEFYKSSTTTESENDKIFSIYRKGNIGYSTVDNFIPLYSFDSYSDVNNSNGVNISTSGLYNNQQAIFNLSTLRGTGTLGNSTNKGWQLSAKGNAWNQGGTTDANAMSLSFWNGTIWNKPIKFSINGNIGLGTTNLPGNKLEIEHGTAGNSGLRFTNLTSSSISNTSSNKVLGLNSSGDIILTNVPGTQNIVDFSTSTPTTPGVVFTPNTPSDESVIYQSAVDNSMWTYNGTIYVTYIPPSSTAWFTSGTINDAGSSKTNAIYRNGSIGINISPITTFHIQNTLKATATNNADAQIFRLSRATTSAIKWDNVFQFNLGSYSTGVNSNTRLDILMNDGATATPSQAFTLLANGRIGVLTTAPVNNVDVVGSFGAAIRSSSTNTTTNSTDHTVVMTSASTILTLETPSSTTTNRRIINVKNNSTGNASVTGNIDGVVQTLTLATKESRMFHSDGTTWYII